MIYLIIVAVIGVALFTWTQYRKGKGQKVEKDALTLAWERKDHDAYLALLDEKIAKSGAKKDKHVLATLKMPVYLLREQWPQMDALKKNVNMALLPKKIRVTFLCQYIIGLCLSDRPDAALALMQKEAALLQEAEANGTYRLYIDTIAGLKSFYSGDHDDAIATFTALEAENVQGDLYPPLFATYRQRAEAAKAEADA